MAGNIGNRNYLFDNIKAILIFSVVLAHYFRASTSFDTENLGGIVYIASFSYIMQAFFFISGYFSGNPQKCRDNAFKTFLYPYLILMPVMYGIRYLIFGDAHFDLTLPTMALWYLLTLFFYRYFLIDLIKIKKILLISFFVSLTAGFIPFFNSTLAIGRTLAFLPFFLMGYYFKEEWIEKIRRIPKPAALMTLVILLCFIVALTVIDAVPLEAFHMKNSYGSTGLGNFEGVAIRLLLSVVSIIWIMIFINLLPRRKTFFAVIGQNTMTVYILHIIIRYFVKAIEFPFDDSSISFLLLAVLAVLSVWFFSRPSAAALYHRIMEGLYRWTVVIPRTLIRQIL
ncbi:MAG: hypothetical protein K0Q48_2106 [Bacillota bacterium]|nr:hypothetical protein [Bacillota bacterium]